MTHRRRSFVVIAGAAVFAAYVLVALVTIQARDGHVRPLFEGVGPSAPYQWVNPPKAFAANNIKPHANDSQVPLGPDGNLLAGAGSTDGQLVINLPQGSIPAHPGDDHITFRTTPLDPATLGKTDPSLRPNGNAYRVDATYQPSGTPIPALTKAGNIVLTVPEPSQGLLYSQDGATWQKLQSQEVGGPGTVGGPFSQTGLYLGATSAFTASTSGGSSGSGGGSSIVGIVVVGALTIVVAGALIFGPGVARRIKRRRQQGESAQVRAARTQQATARRRKKR